MAKISELDDNQLERMILKYRRLVKGGDEAKKSTLKRLLKEEGERNVIIDDDDIPPANRYRSNAVNNEPSAKEGLSRALTNKEITSGIIAATIAVLATAYYLSLTISDKDSIIQSLGENAKELVVQYYSFMIECIVEATTNVIDKNN